MKRVGILALRWTAVAIVAATLVHPQELGAQGPAQGIRVHGHWVIEVRNADGTLQLRREFDNALLDGGKTTLASLLIGQSTIDLWRIIIAPTDFNTGGLCNGSPNGTCIVAEPSDPDASPFASRYLFKNLTKTVVNSTLVLQGGFIAGNPAVISTVSTQTWRSGVGQAFTGTTLPTPIPVQATQQVSLTVTISFS